MDNYLVQKWPGAENVRINNETLYWTKSGKTTKLERLGKGPIRTDYLVIKHDDDQLLDFVRKYGAPDLQQSGQISVSDFWKRQREVTRLVDLKDCFRDGPNILEAVTIFIREKFDELKDKLSKYSENPFEVESPGPDLYFSPVGHPHSDNGFLPFAEILTWIESSSVVDARRYAGHLIQINLNPQFPAHYLRCEVKGRKGEFKQSVQAHGNIHDVVKFLLWSDEWNRQPFRRCANPTCLKFFKCDAQLNRRYCKKYCQHIETVRRSRQKAALSKKGNKHAQNKTQRKKAR